MLTWKRRVIAHVNGDCDARRRRQAWRRTGVDGSGRSENNHSWFGRLLRFGGFWGRLDENRRRVRHADRVLLFQSTSEAADPLEVRQLDRSELTCSSCCPGHSDATTDVKVSDGGVRVGWVVWNVILKWQI